MKEIKLTKGYVTVVDDADSESECGMKLEEGTGYAI